MKSALIFVGIRWKIVTYLYNETPVKPVQKAIGAEIWLVQNLNVGFVRPWHGVTETPPKKTKKSENSNDHNFLLP